MVKYLLAALFLTGVALSCNNSKDILATYNGGLITRGELYSRLKYRDLSIDMFRKKKMFQEKELRMMGLDRIAILEAKKNNFDKSDRFQFLSKDIQSRLLGSFLLEKVIQKEGFTEPAVKVRHIVIKVIDDERQSLRTAMKILSLLEKGESFEDLAREFSSDVTRTKGGLLGYIIYGMLPPEYTHAAFSLEPGEHTRKPVLLQNKKRIFIIKTEEKVDLTDKNFNRIISNPKMKKSYRIAILKKKRSVFIESLKHQDNVTISENLKPRHNGNHQLFKIQNKTYTVNDINIRIKHIKKISQSKKPVHDELFWSRVARKYLVAELLKNEALRRGIDKDPEYIQKYNVIMSSFLAGDYMEFYSRKTVSVKESEIKKEYIRNREKKYTHYNNTGNKKIKKILPYNKVHDQIATTLQNMKAMKIKTRWSIDIMKKYNFLIAANMLEGE